MGDGAFGEAMVATYGRRLGTTLGAMSFVFERSVLASMRAHHFHRLPVGSFMIALLSMKYANMPVTKCEIDCSIVAEARARLGLCCNTRTDGIQ